MTESATLEVSTPEETNTPEVQYVGDGNYTANMLSTWKGIEKRLLARGHKQAPLDYIYVTSICSKGHEDHLNRSAAAEKFFPGVSAITATSRVQKVQSDFIQQLFSGQTIEDNQAAWDETHKKPETNGTRPRLSLEEKAERIARHELNVAFRNAKGVGNRGRLKPDVQEELERHMDKYLANAISKIISDLQE